MVTINDLEVPSILTLDSITAWILCHCVMLSNYFFLKCANFSDSWIIFGAMSREHDKNKSNFILNVTHFFFSSLWETQKSINNINTQAIYMYMLYAYTWSFIMVFYLCWMLARMLKMVFRLINIYQAVNFIWRKGEKSQVDSFSHSTRSFTSFKQKQTIYHFAPRVCVDWKWKMKELRRISEMLW